MSSDGVPVSSETRSSGAQRTPVPERACSGGFVTPDLISSSSEPTSSEPIKKTKRTADTHLVATDKKTEQTGMTDESPVQGFMPKSSGEDDSLTKQFPCLNNMIQKKRTPADVSKLFFKVSKDLPLTREEEEELDEYYGFGDVLGW